MVFRRGLALLCVAAAVALANVNTGVDAAVHKRVHHTKETEINYPNGVVHISTQDDGKAPEKHQRSHKHHHHHHAKKVDADSEDSSDDRKVKHAKHAKKASPKKAAADTTKEETIKYDHGSVRISKPKSAGVAKDAHLHKTTTVQKVHATTRKHHHHHKQGDVVKDVELKEGVNEFKIAGVPLKITVDDGKVDVNVAGKHVASGAEVTVNTAEKPAKKHHKAAHKAHKKAAEPKKAEEPKKAAEPKKAEELKKAEEPKKAEVTTVAATADSAKVADDKAERVTELATKLANEDRGFFASQTAPVVFICGIIGALAAVVGIAAVAVARAREHSVEDVNLHSVLADASEADLEAATQDAPADQTDSLDDSESDNDDDDDDREGTFANNERAGTVSV
ncbi:hypothetical protein PybrP1_004052 [[Pythium] brassicae (nom. inval.)]|nr:hypothetical protein PybrP1_004052 [[Pythium] brassicae (nom. inval.)]